MAKDVIYGVRLLVRCRPNRKEIHRPKTTIQIKLLLAVESRTRGLSVGSKRNDAKIRAARTVPIALAVLPNRKAMKTIGARNRNGNTDLKELP
jgi:hypothetical protein